MQKQTAAAPIITILKTTDDAPSHSINQYSEEPTVKTNTKQNKS